MGLLAAGMCLEQFPVRHAGSPLSEMRRMGLKADDFPDSFRAVVIDRENMKPLGAFGGLLWVAGGAVVADGSLIGDVIVVDGTRLRAGERVAVGRLGGEGRRLGARAMVRRLIEAGLIRTYWHVESTVCLEGESAKDGEWEGRYTGEHVYFTSGRETGRFAFTVHVAADGRVAVTGR